jgi:hypothetical protein
MQSEQLRAVKPSRYAGHQLSMPQDRKFSATESMSDISNGFLRVLISANIRDGNEERVNDL